MWSFSGHSIYIYIY